MVRIASRKSTSSAACLLALALQPPARLQQRPVPPRVLLQKALVLARGHLPDLPAARPAARLGHHHLLGLQKVGVQLLVLARLGHGRRRQAAQHAVVLARQELQPGLDLDLRPSRRCLLVVLFVVLLAVVFASFAVVFVAVLRIAFFFTNRHCLRFVAVLLVAFFVIHGHCLL